MLCKKIEDNEIEKWEEYVENNQTIAWQSYYWSQVVGKHYNTEFYPIAAFEGDRICGVMPLYRTKSLNSKTTLMSVPYAVGGGIAADDKDAEMALISTAIRMYEQINADRIVFKQYKHKLEGPLSTDDNFYNKELDLTKGSEKIFNDFDHKNQKYIVKAKDLTLELEYPSRNIDVFYKLLLRHHKNAGIPCVSLAWLKDLISFKMYGLALLKDKGKIVAGTMVKEHKKSVSFPFTAIPNVNDTNIMFGYNLYWKLLCKFIDDGKEIFHSGRIPKTEDTACYRLGWGGKKYNYYYQYYPENTQATEYKAKRGRKRQIVSAIWKHLPLGVTGWIGPKVTRYFP